VISYEYKTHPPAHVAGWRGTVPDPKNEGVWFYIDFHDPRSNSQIHTQPFMEYTMFYHNKKVMFLVLEGNKTKKITDTLWNILIDKGVRVVEP